MMELHLVRHGKTVANEKGLYLGHANPPLSDNGAAEIADFESKGIYPANPGRFFVSGLTRTIQTLDIIYGPVDREVVATLREYNFGIFDLKSYEELKDLKDYQAWTIDDTGTVACPGGENRIDFKNRVMRGLEYVMKEPSFVVCHGGVIVCVMQHFWPDIKHYYQWQPEPGRGYTLICDQKKITSYREL